MYAFHFFELKKSEFWWKSRFSHRFPVSDKPVFTAKIRIFFTEIYFFRKWNKKSKIACNNFLYTSYYGSTPIFKPIRPLGAEIIGVQNLKFFRDRSPLKINDFNTWIDKTPLRQMSFKDHALAKNVGGVYTYNIRTKCPNQIYFCVYIHSKTYLRDCCKGFSNFWPEVIFLCILFGWVLLKNQWISDGFEDPDSNCILDSTGNRESLKILENHEILVHAWQHLHVPGYSNYLSGILEAQYNTYEQL